MATCSLINKGAMYTRAHAAKLRKYSYVHPRVYMLEIAYNTCVCMMLGVCMWVNMCIHVTDDTPVNICDKYSNIKSCRMYTHTVGGKDSPYVQINIDR